MPSRAPTATEHQTRPRTWSRATNHGPALAGIHDAEGIIWFAMIISAVHLARPFLNSNRIHEIMDRIISTVLIGFGPRFALSNR